MEKPVIRPYTPVSDEGNEPPLASHTPPKSPKLTIF
jgi:hypothetical protein